jgi:hypothetical protein
MRASASDVWHFKRELNGHWSWQRQSLHHELVEGGQTTFEKFDDCLADARRSGYIGTLSLETPQQDASARLLRRTRR